MPLMWCVVIVGAMEAVRGLVRGARAQGVA
jgi:hypothetical protein